MNIDVFNGDADGICALLQWRLAYPCDDALLVTGVKRDIGLLSRVNAQPGDQMIVLDISMDKNRSALLALLQQGVEVFYVDHHFAGEIPEHPRLTVKIDTDAEVCSSLLMDAHLEHRYSAWAVTAAFGDNLEVAARHLAENLAMSATQVLQLQQLGVAINYNAYGESLADLHCPPDEVYRQLLGYLSPVDFIADKPQLFQQWIDAYAEDMLMAQRTLAEYQTDAVAVYLLADEKWARRVSGVWGNQLANLQPQRAHAVLTHNQHQGYLISVRAPLQHKTGADELCRRFGGGGRKGAAGIDHLPYQQLGEFIQAFEAQYPAK